MKASEKVVRGIKATFVAQLVNVVANGLLIVVLTRFLLRPGGYGLLFLVISIVSVAQLFADLGLARSAARYVAEYKESDPPQVPHILRTSLGYRLLFVVVVCVVLGLGRNVIADVLNEPAIGPLVLIGTLFLAGMSIHKFNAVVFQGFNAVEWSALVNVVNNVGRVAFSVLFVTLGLGVAGALLGYVVSAALAAVLGLSVLYLRFYRNFEIAAAPEAGLRRRIAEYSVPLTASRSANVIDKRVDIILIGFFLSPLAVGFYTLAKQISNLVLAPAGSVGFAVSPMYGEDKSNDNLERAARVYETSMQYVMLLYVPAAVGLVLVAEPAILLVFGEGYAGAIPVVQVLSVFIVFRAVASVTTQAIDYLGRARYRAIVKGVTSLANFGLNVLLIPLFGVVGAAVATVFTFGLYTIASVYVMHLELPLRYGRLRRIAVGSTLVSAAMGACVLLVAPQVSGFVGLAGVVLLGVLVWGVLVTRVGLLDVRETLSLLT